MDTVLILMSEVLIEHGIDPRLPRGHEMRSKGRLTGHGTDLSEPGYRGSRDRSKARLECAKTATSLSISHPVYRTGPPQDSGDWTMTGFSSPKHVSNIGLHANCTHANRTG